jgi:DNA-binding MarR family transcriptional regulator
MPKAQRERRERTDNYQLLLQWCRTPEQRLYEGIRPITLFGIPPAERAQETGLAESSLRPSHHTVKAVLADGPPPSRTTRQFPRYEEIIKPEERRHAVMRLHAQGWSISTIARYLEVSRPTIYAILKRWVEEGCRAFLINRTPIPVKQASIYRHATLFAKSKRRILSLGSGECMPPSSS